MTALSSYDITTLGLGVEDDLSNPLFELLFYLSGLCFERNINVSIIGAFAEHEFLYDFLQRFGGQPLMRDFHGKTALGVKSLIFVMIAWGLIILAPKVAFAPAAILHENAILRLACTWMYLQIPSFAGNLRFDVL